MSKKTQHRQQSLQKNGELSKLALPAKPKPPAEQGKIPATKLQAAVTQLLRANLTVREQKVTIASLQLENARLSNLVLGQENRDAEAVDLATRARYGLPQGTYSLHDDDQDKAKQWIVVQAGALPAPPTEDVSDDAPEEESVFSGDPTPEAGGDRLGRPAPVRVDSDGFPIELQA